MYQFSCFSLSISGPDTPQFLVAVQNEDQQLKKIIIISLNSDYEKKNEIRKTEKIKFEGVD